MTLHLFSSSVNPVAASFPTINKKFFNQELLMQKRENLYQWTNYLREQMASIEREQLAMYEATLVIRKDQKAIKQQQKVLKDSQERMDQKNLKIKEEQLQIKIQAELLNQMYLSLFKKALEIENDQKKIKNQLENIEEKRKDLHQSAFLVDQNDDLIKHNLDKAREVVAVIQQDQEMIEIKIDKMEQNVQDIQQNELNLANHTSSKSLDLEEKQKEGTNEIVFSPSFWFLLLQKIKNTCFLLISQIGSILSIVHQSIK